MSARLALALVLSIIGHVLLLSMLARPAVPSVRLPTLEVVLTGTRAAAPAAATGASAAEDLVSPPRAAPAMPADQPTLTAPSSVQTAAKGATTAASQEPLATAQETLPTTLPTPDYSRPLATPRSLSPRERLATQPANATENSGIVLAIRQRLAQFQAYPTTARRRGVEGAATVQFVISRDGHLLTKSLLESSGSPHLDQAALKLVSDAAPYPELPATLSGERLEVQIPIDYRLNTPAT